MMTRFFCVFLCVSQIEAAVNVEDFEKIYLTCQGQDFEFIKIPGKKDKGRTIHMPFEIADRDYYHKRTDMVKTIQKVYTARNFRTIKEKNFYSIPPIIHQIWFGGSFPEKYKQYQKQIFKTFPGYLYKLWDEKEVDRLQFDNKKFLPISYSYTEQSNIVRYELLNEFGGIYLDTDIQLIRTLDPFNRRFNFYVGLEPFPDTTIGTAVIGAAPGHPILKKAIKKVEEGWIEASKLKSPQMRRTGVLFWTDVVMSEIKKHPLSSIFPPTYFYPWKAQWDSKGKNSRIRRESYLIHDFDVTWKKK